MTLKIVRFDDVTPQPWKNGGGVTRELLRLPATGDWNLRISLADIAADGPFSAFEGVERWFAVIEGNGVRLDWNGRERLMDMSAWPLCFDGADAPGCRLLDVAPLWEAQVAIEAALPTAQEARLLGIERTEPCLIVVRRTVSRGLPVTLARLVHPGARYALEGRFRP